MGGEGDEGKRGRKAHHFNMSELLCKDTWILTHQLNVDLRLGIYQSLHGNCIHLGQDVFVFV